MNETPTETPVLSLRAEQGRIARFFDAIFGAPVRPCSYEEIALQILAENRSLGLAALVQRVADEVMRAERHRGGAAVDIGIWGPAVYRREAITAVQRMLGRTLVLEGEGPFMLVVPTVPLPHVARRPRFIAALSGA